MQLNWRAISGPALTTATALLAFLVDRHFFPIPNPAPLLVCIVALAASVSGIASGSLHGWLWLAAAFAGSVIGTRLRPLFGLSVERS